jgi:hypothetical protein
MGNVKCEGSLGLTYEGDAPTRGTSTASGLDPQQSSLHHAISTRNGVDIKNLVSGDLSLTLTIITDIDTNTQPQRIG